MNVLEVQDPADGAPRLPDADTATSLVDIIPEGKEDVFMEESERQGNTTEQAALDEGTYASARTALTDDRGHRRNKTVEWQLLGLTDALTELHAVDYSHIAQATPSATEHANPAETLAANATRLYQRQKGSRRLNLNDDLEAGVFPAVSG